MRRALFLFFLLITYTLLQAQQRSIRGRVLDAQGVPLAGVSITIKGNAGGTVTDAQGNFAINAATGNTLVFSYVGQQKELTLANEETLSVSFDEQSRQLSEVVVTALGQTRNKDRVGYSASTFRSEDIVRSAPVSALDGLQGRVAGADISTIGGQPGSSSRIIVRGYTSIGGQSNQALIVVDGVPFNNSRLGSFNDFANSGGVDFGNGLNDINPNDIENITILKGAAATSLYGSRAQNGVVLITTKKGRAGRISVDVTSSAIGTTVGKLPEFQNVWGQGWSGLHYKEENGSWGPKMDGKERLWGSNVDNSRLIKPFSPVKDNVRHFYDMGSEFNNTVAVRGGSENSAFYLSFGNVYNDGIMPTNVDVYRRNTLSLRGSTKTDKFLASASLNYINKNGSTVSSDDNEAGSSTFENVIQIARDMDITDFKDYKNKFFNVDNYFTPYAANPYFSLLENRNKYQNDRFFGNVEFGYDFTKKL
ncbi:MAG TPA: TonB-dependent receptor plug domain-containing protein, partial [Chitinophagaceae bacterium]|nr:TonB-dependent receptor plug domain-containing protein [Chitinophagaceae bacterium]